MDHTRLNDRERPGGGHRVGQSFQAVADHDANVLHTAVLDLGEHREAKLRALGAVTCPQPKDVAFPVAGHSDGSARSRPPADAMDLARGDSPFTPRRGRFSWPLASKPPGVCRRLRTRRGPAQRASGTTTMTLVSRRRARPGRVAGACREGGQSGGATDAD